MKNAAKYTVITGASSGIGYEIAKAFAARGKHLIIVARRRERLEKLKQEIAEQYPALNIVIESADLSVLTEVQRLYEKLRGYAIETWINNAGVGNYDSVAQQSIDKITAMLRLNIEALTLFSSLFVRDYHDEEKTQLINLSSCGGYIIVPNAVTYCAAKFYVSAFTEGLARELIESGAKLRAKVLAPAATKTEFGAVANHVRKYDYDACFGKYHTSRQMAAFLLELYDSDQTVGWVDRETFKFQLSGPRMPYAGQSSGNQKLENIK